MRRSWVRFPLWALGTVNVPFGGRCPSPTANRVASIRPVANRVSQVHRRPAWRPFGSRCVRTISLRGGWAALGNGHVLVHRHRGFDAPLGGRSGGDAVGAGCSCRGAADGDRGAWWLVVPP